jgi:polyhydroxybutyrate depolymerase
MKKLLTIFILLPLLSFSQLSFDWDNQEREYFLYIPESLQEDAPLVFVLHGYYDTGNGWVDKFQYLADLHGFVVCAPTGLLDNNGNTHWNANFSPLILGQNMTSVDDIGFLSSLAIFLQGEYDLDPNKTFSCGFSNGGFMSWSLACNAPNVFRAIASVAGSMSANDWEDCNPDVLVPVMQISGTNDDIIPIDGSTGGWPFGGGTPDIYSIMNFWSNMSGCIASETINWEFDNYYDYELISYYGDCFNNTAESRLYLFNEMGHVWPSNTFNNDESIPDLAAEYIWSFFMQLAAQPLVEIEEDFNCNKDKLKEIDILGREVNSKTVLKIEIYNDGSVDKKIILK